MEQREMAYGFVEDKINLVECVFDGEQWPMRGTSAIMQHLDVTLDLDAC